MCNECAPPSVWEQLSLAVDECVQLFDLFFFLIFSETEEFSILLILMLRFDTVRLMNSYHIRWNEAIWNEEKKGKIFRTKKYELNTENGMKIKICN